MIVDKKWITDNYKKFNKLYFNNELPEIKVRISSSKNYLGTARAYFDEDNNRMEGFTISISNYFDQPEEVKFFTLLHEMIHIKDYVVNSEEVYQTWMSGKRRGHGYFFTKEAERVTKESGILITAKATSEQMKTSVYSEETKKKLSEDYIALVSPDRGHVMFRLPKVYNERTVIDIMLRFGLKSCSLIKGDFVTFKGKRGSIRSGRVIGERMYNYFYDYSKSHTDDIYIKDSTETIMNKIKNI